MVLSIGYPIYIEHNGKLITAEIVELDNIRRKAFVKYEDDDLITHFRWWDFDELEKVMFKVMKKG